MVRHAPCADILCLYYRNLTPVSITLNVNAGGPIVVTLAVVAPLVCLTLVLLGTVGVLSTMAIKRKKRKYAHDIFQYCNHFATYLLHVDRITQKRKNHRYI